MPGGAGEPPYVTAFRDELRVSDPAWMVHKHILSGESRMLPLQSYHALRAEIADWARVHVNEVVMVGSGKLGFSVNPEQPLKLFDEESDFDIAIISSGMFDWYWKRVFLYSRVYAYWKEQQEFNDYLLRGWMRPELLPPSGNFGERREWWTFFGKISNKQAYGRRKIRAGIYKTWEFLEAYQTDGMRQCKLQIGRGE